MHAAGGATLRWALAAAMALAGAACITVSIRLSLADDLARRPELASAARAVRLAPGSARYRLRQAALLERDNPAGGDAAVGRLLEDATTIEPRLAEPWMQRGLYLEIHGHKNQAEQMLLRAADADHTFKPAWTLANFYARHADIDKFWTYARQCLQLTEPAGYAPEPVFDLCWRVSDDAPTILNRAVPPVPPVRAAYALYLTSLRKPSAALPAWRTLNRTGMADEFGPSLPLCDLLIQTGDAAGAVEVWNGYAAAHGRAGLDPARGRSLTDGNLEREPAGRGFNWALPRSHGIDNRYFGDENEVRVELDGDQPESAELLTQNIPVVPGARYRLRFQYQTTDIEPGSGLSWAAVEPATGAPQPSTCASLSSAEPAGGACEFQTASGQSLLRLALRYSRPLGTLRAHGSIRISHVRLERLA
ncbi:MAG TPA: hypothetical protein DEQ47_04960 [Solibacterales bacterium]|nr:hypothetical protein [Bryobacterales bacterium]